MMRFLSSLFLTFLVSACVSVAPVRDANNINDKIHFSMDSRFAVQYVEDGANKSLTGKMQWEESENATDVVLASPLGTAMASLHLTNHEATLKTANGEMYSEKTAEALLDRILGYELPLSNMRQMIGSSQTKLPEHIRYDIWDIQVLSRFSNPNLARKLLITRQNPTLITMTLFIDERSDAPNE